MVTPLISIIVPIYKVESYLQECIDSILAQTFTNFELILVDDGSPDSSGTVCDSAATQDARIRVLHQSNQGVTQARANGVAAAKGVFITFVDGDDTLPTHSLATLVEHADAETDIVLGKTKGFRCPPKGTMSLDEYREACVTLQTTHGAPWAKLFRKSLFSKDIFSIPPDIILGEDVLMNILLAYKAQGKIYSTNADVYNYRPNYQGATLSSHPLEIRVKCQAYRLNIIPEEDVQRFLPKGLATNLIQHWHRYSHSLVIIPQTTRGYHRYLLSIAKYANLNLGLLSRILFNCTNPIIRACIIPLCYVANKTGRLMSKVQKKFWGTEQKQNYFDRA